MNHDSAQSWLLVVGVIVLVLVVGGSSLSQLITQPIVAFLELFQGDSIFADHPLVDIVGETIRSILIIMLTLLVAIVVVGYLWIRGDRSSHRR